MNGIQHFQTLAKYNTRLNQQVLAAASSLSHDQLNENRGAFFKSILGTLNHILVGDLLWLRRFYLHHGPNNQAFSKLKALDSYPAIESLNQTLFDDFEAFKTVRIEVDTSINDWINTQLSEADLDSTFTYQNIKGESANKNFGEVLSHLFNHQTHHRGQVSTLLSQKEQDIGITDYLEDIEILDSNSTYLPNIDNILGLKPGYTKSIIQSDELRFIIGISDIFDKLLLILIENEIDNHKDLKDILKYISISDKKIGKLRFAKILLKLKSYETVFIGNIIEIRNCFAHNSKLLYSNIQDVFNEFTREKQKQIRKNILEFSTISYNNLENNPNISILLRKTCEQLLSTLSLNHSFNDIRKNFDKLNKQKSEIFDLLDEHYDIQELINDMNDL
jgi:uncharacterized damage-inducible protein DinB